jgi:hypothetical protein
MSAGQVQVITTSSSNLGVQIVCTAEITISGWYTCSQDSAGSIGLKYLDAGLVWIAEFMVFSGELLTDFKIGHSKWKGDSPSDDFSTDEPLTLKSANYGAQTGDNIFEGDLSQSEYVVKFNTDYLITTVMVFGAEDTSENPSSTVPLSAEDL